MAYSNGVPSNIISTTSTTTCTPNGNPVASHSSSSSSSPSPPPPSSSLPLPLPSLPQSIKEKEPMTAADTCSKLKCPNSPAGASSDGETGTDADVDTHTDADAGTDTNTPTAATSESSCTCQARNQILQMGSDIGILCLKIQQYAPCNANANANVNGEQSFWLTDSQEKNEVYDAVCNLFHSLLILCKICDIELNVAIVKKMELNNKKYPVELCKGKSVKYTYFSNQTGITKQNQSTLDNDKGNGSGSGDSNDENQSTVTFTSTSMPTTIQEFLIAIRQFASDRNWFKYHTPRNITLAMLGELGELAELFQWKSDDVYDGSDADADADVDSNGRQGSSDGAINQNNNHLSKVLQSEGWPVSEIDKVQQEIADVAIYCLRLADVIGMKDMGNVVM